MKKILILLCLICLFFVGGCGNRNAVNTQSEGQETNASATDATENAEAASEEDPALPLSDKVIVIDAGHGINSYTKREAVAPGSSEMKIAFSGGTSGKNQTEEQLNLKVAKKLEALLTKMGASVYMTRTEAKSDMTNIDRAEFANDLNADLSVRIHADGNTNPNVKGMSMLVPSPAYVTNEVYNSSMEAGKIVLDEAIKTTGAANRGIVERNDLTGFNWSKVPVILIEMGFMTNPDEDALLDTDEYQQKIADGIGNGVVKYFETGDMER